MGALRLFLACGVVLDHIRGHLDQQGMGWSPDWTFGIVGGRSVYLFYIVSGFLISYVLETKYPETKAGTYQFYKARFLRIYPLWWIVLAVSAAVSVTAWPAGITQIIGAVALIGSDFSVFLSTARLADVPVFPPNAFVGWTLGAELTFYLLAPYLLRSDRAGLMVLIASATARAIVFFAVDRHIPHYTAWYYFFLPATFMLFMLGHFARRVAARLRIGLSTSIMLLIAVAALSTAATRFRADGGHAVSPITDALLDLSFPLFALALPGIFQATKDSCISNTLGDLTYPLYLTHSLVFLALNRQWPIIGTPDLSLVRLANSLFISGHTQGATLFVCSLLICLVAALFVRNLVEVPMVALWRRILNGAERRPMP